MKTILFRFFLLTFVVFATLVFFYFPGKSTVEHMVEVPFSFEREIILLDVMLNGKGPYTMGLDTGTDPSVIDSKVAADITWLRIPLGAHGTGSGSDTVDISLLAPVIVQVGAIPAARKLALGVDLANVSERMGKPIHGILGHNFLEDHVVEIDYPARKIRFHPLSSSVSVNEASGFEKRLELPMRYLAGENFPLIESFMVNGEEIKVTLDTGSNGNLTLYPEAVKYLGLEENVERAVPITTEGYGGKLNKRVGQVDTLMIKNWVIDSQQVSFLTGGPHVNTPLASRGGNLGNGILKNFVVTLDYPGRTVWLEKR